MTQRRERTQPLRRPRMTWTPKRIAALILLVLGLILILQNWGNVHVNVLFWQFTLRLAWALLGVFLLGILVGWLGPHLFAVTHRSRVHVTTSSGQE